MKRILSLILAAMILSCATALADIDDITPEYAYQYLKESAGFDDMKDESIAWMLWALQIEAHNRGLNVRNAIEEPAAATQPAASVTLPPDSDLSGMSLGDLQTLSEQVTMAMWATGDWQEVTVPAGLYQVGVEIPAGKWTISAMKKGDATVRIGSELEENGMAISFNGRTTFYLYGVEHYAYDESKATSTTVTLTNGQYIKFDATVIFTPYAGPGFTFK